MGRFVVFVIATVAIRNHQTLFISQQNYAQKDSNKECYYC